MKKIAKLVGSSIFSALIISAATLHAEWDPENCFTDAGEYDFQQLQAKDFVSLKTSVVDFLKGSWCSEEKINLMMDLVVLTRPEVCVEIGAFTGSSVLPVAATLKFLNHGNLLAIDAWSNSEATKYLAPGDPNREWWSSVNMKDVRKIFQNLIKLWSLNQYCTVINKSSTEAVDEIYSIDFLHLDGDYSEKMSMLDVKNYLPKVKTGGFILISNLLVVVDGATPKMESFDGLFESCELICEIDRSNAVLFRKM